MRILAVGGFRHLDRPRLATPIPHKFETSIELL